MTKKIVSDIQALLEEYAYDPESGSIVRRKDGTQAFSTKHAKGYLQGRIKGVAFLAHRVAWAIHHGEWPDGQVDHINNVKTDNRISNLRVCSNAENHFNMKKTKANTTGYKGVYFCKRDGMFTASIMKNGQTFSLGRYADAEQAHEAYKRAAIRHHGSFANFG